MHTVELLAILIKYLKTMSTGFHKREIRINSLLQLKPVRISCPHIESVSVHATLLTTYYYYELAESRTTRSEHKQ